MERIEIYIILIVVGSVVGLIVTSDNEPPPYISEEERNDSLYVDTIPSERSIHNKTIIKNPNIDFDK